MIPDPIRSHTIPPHFIWHHPNPWTTLFNNIFSYHTAYLSDWWYLTSVFLWNPQQFFLTTLKSNRKYCSHCLITNDSSLVVLILLLLPPFLKISFLLSCNLKYSYRSSETVKLIDLLDAAKDRMRDSLQARADEGKCPLKVCQTVCVINYFFWILLSTANCLHTFCIFLILYPHNFKTIIPVLWFILCRTPTTLYCALTSTITFCLKRPVSA